ncbi:MAG: helix-turn-helix domain-containing protein [Dehalococcoidia bacterium]|nr:helix-turn-helix domain-containing protein [Dehalococcoidia bacterium]
MEKEAIKALRLACGESQSQFASRLGVTANTVARWEQGVISPGLYYAEKLRRVRGQVNRHAPANNEMGVEDA